MIVGSASVFQEILYVGLSRQGRNPIQAVRMTIRSASVLQESLRVGLSRQDEDLIKDV